MDDKEYTKHSARWLFEMNWVNNDYVKSAILANIYTASKYIKNLDILVDQENKRMLVYLEIGFCGKLFMRKEAIKQTVSERITDALHDYTIRVVYDYSIFKAALKLMTPEVPKTIPKPKKEEAEEESKKEEE